MQSACFIDADNIPSPEGSEWGGQLEDLLNSNCRVRRAYALGKQIGSVLSKWLFTHSFDRIDAYSPVSGKNSADIHMTISMIEEGLRATEKMRFIIATGDSDFAPVIKRLFELGHELTIIAPQGHLSKVALSLPADYIEIKSQLLKDTSRPFSDPSITNLHATKSAPSTNQLMSALSEEFKEQTSILLVNLAHSLNRRFGIHWYKALGHNKLIELFKTLPNIQVTQNKQSGDYIITWAEDQDTWPRDMMDGQPSAEQVREIIFEAYKQKERWALPQLHQLILDQYPNFTYLPQGHKKLSAYLHEIIPELQPCPRSPNTAWRLETQSNLLQDQMVELEPIEIYKKTLKQHDLSIESLRSLTHITAWLNAKKQFQGIAKTSTECAEQLELSKKIVQSCFNALYKAHRLHTEQRDGEPTLYTLISSSDLEHLHEIKRAFRTRLASLEPLDEELWLTFWAPLDLEHS